MTGTYSTQGRYEKCLQNFVENLVSKRQHDIPSHRKENNIKICFKGVECEGLY
jgi:hypothetical protein